jgi:hypothetical protein
MNTIAPRPPSIFKPSFECFHQVFVCMSVL